VRLTTLTREASALLRQAPLLGRALGRRVPGREAENGDVVVLLHGFFATAGVFEPLERHLARGEAPSLASFTYGPTRTFPSLVDELADCLAALPRTCRIRLVGHSLGGVLARWYVQELGDPRVVATVSLASPFRGTTLADGLPGPLTKEMRPASPRLRLLLDPTKIDEARVPHTSFVASADSVVVPVDSAAFPRGEVVRVAGVGHNGILFHQDTLAHVASLVRRSVT
jgi:alpha-beta hydrolase superfamily lysophospholipase